MPPLIKRLAMAKMAERVERCARQRGSGTAALEDVHRGCAEVLANKDRYMLESLLSALQDEGYSVDEAV